MDENSNWSLHQMFVLNELKRLNENVEKLVSSQTPFIEKYFGLTKEIEIIKTKLMVIGAAFGFLGSSVSPIFNWLADVIK